MASKTCFVTVGGTATFPDLISGVLAAPFTKALQSHNYSELVVQYGAGGKEAFDAAAKGVSGISVSGFELDKAGLGKYLKQAKEGVVISHAGMRRQPYNSTH